MQQTCFKNSITCNAALNGFNSSDWLAYTGQVGHLFDGLTYLLQAAQEWQLQKDLKLELVGYQAQVYAMDSVFLRARSLFEFFAGEGRPYCHARCLFDLDDQLEYPKYAVKDGSQHPELWENILHVGSLHFQNRATTRQLIGYDGTNKDLNEMPADFAKGILDVWQEFEDALNVKGYQQLHGMAEACRNKAIEDAGRVFDSVVQRTKAYESASTDGLVKLFG
ncbi:MAG TPA: hypothetical protein VFB59_01320 [Candidatus Saccharimonadales bacterium]|nr:hypothetical protein [Candidatus Saccharimonadales bacterium]